MKKLFKKLKAHQGAVIIMTLNLLIACYFIRPFPSINPSSRFATVQSLVEEGSFHIDNTVYIRSTGDYVKIGDHFISSKPPFLSVVAAGIYKVMNLFGFEVGNNAFRVMTLTKVVVFLLIMLPWLFMMIIFYKWLLLFCGDQFVSTLTLLLFSFSYLGWGYTIEFQNHTIAASWILAAFYFLYKYFYHGSQRKDVLLSGLFSGLAFVCDLGTAVLCFALFVLLALKKDWKAVSIFIVAALPAVLVNSYLTFLATGTITPTYQMGKYFKFEGSYWLNKRNWDALNENKFVYAFHSLLGRKGFFTMTPLTLFVFPVWKKIFKEKKFYFRETIVIVSAILLTMLIYFKRTRNYGGVCIGFRWFLILTPFFYIYLSLWLKEHKEKLMNYWILILPAFLVGFINSAYAFTDTPFQNGLWVHLWQWIWPLDFIKN